MKIEKPMWTRGDIARIYRVTVRTVDRWRKEGLPACVDQPPRFDPDEVKAWLQQRRAS